MVEMKQPTATGLAKVNIWIPRVLIGIVLFWNLQAAVYFVLKPELFVSSFELVGVPGSAAVVGIGILFLMWQVPYIFALVHPVKFRVSLLEAIAMQAIGLVAESWLRSTISVDFALLRSSILRFIIFDGTGLLVLIIAFLLVNKNHLLIGKIKKRV